MFLIKFCKDGEARDVTHYHYIGWPDGGIPASPAAFLSFLEKIHTNANYNNHDTPIVVHCSGGCGRTGTTILTDSMLEMSQNEQYVDILAQFCLLRKMRVDTVEEFEQYVFVHEVLAESVRQKRSDLKKVEDRSQPVLLSEFQRYMESKKANGELKEQFDSVPLGQTAKWEIGKLPENADKNRYSTSAAYDHSRVKLEIDDPSDDTQTDYINACWIHSYNTPQRYIAMQAPIPNTINDVWRLLWQTNASTIVILTKLVDGGKVINIFDFGFFLNHYNL